MASQTLTKGESQMVRKPNIDKLCNSMNYSIGDVERIARPGESLAITLRRLYYDRVSNGDCRLSDSFESELLMACKAKRK
jgi:hypothetical protein